MLHRPISFTEEERLFHENVGHLQSIDRLAEIYGSGDASIDGSFSTHGFKKDWFTGRLKMRYECSFGEKTECDFTIIQNRKGTLVKVHDHLAKKRYKIKAWEGMMLKQLK